MLIRGAQKVHQRGVVSIWVGWLRSRRQLSGYLEELYWDDEAHRSRFASEFDLYDYDDYALEAQFSTSGQLGALLGEISHGASFRDRAVERARELGVADPSTVVILYDFAFEPSIANGEGKKKRGFVFLGTFAYQRLESS